MSKKPGKWVEIGRETRQSGTVRTRYRAVIFDGVKRTRKWFGTREEARRWLELSDDARKKRKDVGTDWRFVFADRAEDIYGRERSFS